MHWTATHCCISPQTLTSLPAVCSPQGGAESAGLLREGVGAMLLCYPPPQETMAMDALSHFRGDTLVYVGEWAGDTATPEFERALLAGWRYIKPFKTVCLPLSYSGNPGVIGVYYRGLTVCWRGGGWRTA